ncbi:MAG: hypothetical protein D6685_14440 [Bacteroidetes bacterium]|nr:MAG: hypothetical protein D6685_14440 [Bacteroidota bacterium]
MTLDTFTRTLHDDAPPAGLPAPLEALWYEARGDWDRAHRLVQDDPSAEAARVHAYLHRKEGDAGNAAYWYRRAGQPRCTDSLDDEWRALVEALLAQP